LYIYQQLKKFNDFLMIILLDLTQLSKGIIGCLRNYCHRKQTHRQEALKMRKVRTSRISSSNPALLFSRGVEQIVSDHLAQQPRFDDQELLAIQRTPKQQQPSSNLFSLLLQQLFWQKC
jgi:hypothetical protein